MVKKWQYLKKGHNKVDMWHIDNMTKKEENKIVFFFVIVDIIDTFLLDIQNK